MHYIVRATIPVDAGNRLVKGDMQSVFDKLMADIRPEQVFFGVSEGQRTLYFVVDIKEPADNIRIFEPLWLALEADVDLIPAMTPDEFASAGPALGHAVSRY